MRKALILTALLTLLSTIVQAQKETSDKGYILVLNSISFSDVWSNGIFQIINQRFDSNGYQIRSEELLVPMINNMQQVAIKTQYLADKYTLRPQLIVCIGDPAWLLCRSLFDTKWKDVPTVICDSRELMPQHLEDLLKMNNRLPRKMVPAKQITSKYNVVPLRYPLFIKQTIEMIRNMIPDLQNIAFISDKRYISVAAREDLKKIATTHFPDLTIKTLESENMSTENLLDSLTSYNANTAIIYYSWFIPRGKGENSYIDDNLQRIIYGFSRAPVFTLSDKDHESGVFAGGYYISMNDFGEQVVELIAKILNGVSPPSIQIKSLVTPHTYLNYHHLEHHGISQRMMPKDAYYFQSPPGFFSKNKIVIICAIAIFAILLVAFFMRCRLLRQRRRQRESELKLLSQYQRMINNMPVMYLKLRRIDPNKSAESDNLELLDVNQGFTTFIGRDREFIIGKTLHFLQSQIPSLQYIGRENLSDTKSIMLIDQLGNETYYDIITFSESNSDYNIIDLFCIDKTDSYNSFVRTEKLNEKHKLVLWATRMSIWTLDLAKRQIEYTAEYEHQNSSLSNTNIIITEKEIIETMHPDDWSKMRHALSEIILNKTTILHKEIRTRKVDEPDQWSWLECFALVSKRDESGTPTMIVGASVHIDSRKKLEWELRSARDQAEESNRLKSAFIANMSHEIRTPLNSIVGFSQILSMTENEQERLEYANIIEHNNTLLLKLINDILDLSKIEAGTLDFSYCQVSLNNLLSEMCHTSRFKLKNSDIEIVFDEPQSDLIIYTDHSRVMQVINNFMTNAMKFTHSGRITMGYDIHDQHVYIYVSDTGRGISADQLGNIFGRFVKLNQFEQGTGLGLPICESIVERLGGEIGVVSEEDKGSTFWFTLPKSPPTLDS